MKFEARLQIKASVPKPVKVLKVMAMLTGYNNAERELRCKTST